MQWMRGIFFSISIFVASNGYARLGETSEAIEKRFNEAVRLVPASSTLPKKLQDRVATRIYQIGANRDGALVEITFLDGVSSREFYFLEREKSQTSRGLNDAQIRFILEVNAKDLRGMRVRLRRRTVALPGRDRIRPRAQNFRIPNPRSI